MRAASETVDYCSRFSILVDNCSLRGSVESRSLRDGFASLPRLIDVSADDLMLSEVFQPPSLCLKGSI